MGGAPNQSHRRNGITVQDHLMPEEAGSLVTRIEDEQSSQHVLVNDIWGSLNIPSRQLGGLHCPPNSSGYYRNTSKSAIAPPITTTQKMIHSKALLLVVLDSVDSSSISG